MWLPITYPTVPITIIGPIKPIQPLLIANAAAVVGPPIFALHASIISSRLNLNNFPKPRVNNKFIIAIMNTNKNNKGALLIMSSIEAGIPITTKNIYTLHLSSCCFVGCFHSPQSHSYLCSWGFVHLPPRCNSKSIRYKLHKFPIPDCRLNY